MELNLPSYGYFVEAGAHDGIGDSRTYHLEQAGWDGLCIEPSQAFNGLTQNRKCRIDHRALWCCNEPLIFWELPGNRIELSGIHRTFRDNWDRSDGVKRRVRGVTLTTMLEEHKAPGRIDYLVLDTEGTEAVILRAHDHSRYRFAVAMIEHNGMPSQVAALRMVMLGNGYELLGSDEINDYYRDKR